MSEIKTYRRRQVENGHLIQQTNLQFINLLKKYSPVNEIRMYIEWFKLLPKYRKLKGYTLKTCINTEEKTIEVWAFNPKNELEFRDYLQLSTTSYLLNYETTYFKENKYRKIILNPSNNGLISQYENGLIVNGQKQLKVRIMRDKTAQKTNPNCVYVIKDLDYSKRYFHIEEDVSNYLLTQNTPPLPCSKDFNLVVPPKKTSEKIGEYISNIKQNKTKTTKPVNYNEVNKNVDFYSISMGTDKQGMSK